MKSEKKPFKTMSEEPNPYHKPAGTYKPAVTPPPIHTLTPAERLHLMFNPKLK